MDSFAENIHIDNLNPDEVADLKGLGRNFTKQSVSFLIVKKKIIAQQFNWDGSADAQVLDFNI